MVDSFTVMAMSIPTIDAKIKLMPRIPECASCVFGLSMHSKEKKLMQNAKNPNITTLNISVSLYDVLDTFMRV
ncbi:MAG: hypothetical protein AAB975_04395, partial [Patescibacteria group bacterium]